ncbi:MAG: addiction module protein [Deltaproteobacteria bacterium]|nr:addiction module protein [Deltaproteobacteria bacterium]
MSAANPDIDSFTTDERLELLDRLWDSLAKTPSGVPVTEAQREELKRRRAELSANPADSLSMEEVERQILSGKGR